MATKKNGLGEKGQILPIVIALLVIISTLVPLMVMYTQKESIWTAKQAASTQAFHMAESGIEKSYLTLSLSTITWVNLQAGAHLTNYLFDKSYTDISGGTYAVWIGSGPLKDQATVISIGRDPLKREIRSVKAVYANNTVGNIAIMAGAGVDESGNNMSVEWGSIVSPGPITADASHHHPSLWSSDNIINLDLDGSGGNNCDSPNCYWWHSYNPGIPPFPTLDFNFYKSSAIASGTSPCGKKYYICSTCTISGGCTDLTGHSFYVEGNWSGFDGPITGNVIVMGSMDTPNGAMGSNNISAKVPQQAWKQYCNDWAAYQGVYETSPYAAACPGLASSYLSPSTLTYNISPVVNGVLYVGGDFTGPNGGGNTDLVYGIIVVKGNVFLNSNSHVKVYYGADASSNLQTTQIILSRASWKDYLTTWPAGLP